MLKKIFKIITIFILFGINYASANTLIERTINGYKAKIIEYKTDSKIYDLKIGVHSKDGGTLRSIMGTVGGVTGVNGVFECPKDYPSCGGKNYTINERYVNGRKRGVYKSTGDRVVFGWNKNMKPFLFQTDKINKNKEKDIFEGFANHPLLLKDGISQVHIYHKKGLIDYKMKSKMIKNFICSNKEGNRIYFGLIYDIDIDSISGILKSFGCWNAINLDAGYSTAFIYNGKYITGPKREILDGVFIVPKNIKVFEIEKSAKKTIKNILEKISKKSSFDKIKELKKINNILNISSKKFYNAHKKEIIVEENKYKYKLIFSGISKNKKMQKLIKTEKFKKIKKVEIKGDNIYKKDFIKTEKKKVGTRIEITKTEEIKKIYEINLLRTYSKELINFYEKIKKLEKTSFLRESDLGVEVKINVNIK